MRLVFLTTNSRWAFLFGDTITRMGDGPMFFATRKEAVAAAARHGLTVNARNDVEAIL